jgi:hypothetical protein
VAAAQVQQAVQGDLSQPGVERQRRTVQVLLQAAGGFGQGLLDHVGGVHAGAQAGVEVEADQPPQPGPVPGQQPVAGRGVTPPGELEQLVGVRLVDFVHRKSPL